MHLWWHHIVQGLTILFLDTQGGFEAWGNVATTREELSKAQLKLEQEESIEQEEIEEAAKERKLPPPDNSFFEMFGW